MGSAVAGKTRHPVTETAAFTTLRDNLMTLLAEINDCESLLSSLKKGQIKKIPYRHLLQTAIATKKIAQLEKLYDNTEALVDLLDSVSNLSDIRQIRALGREHAKATHRTAKDLEEFLSHYLINTWNKGEFGLRIAKASNNIATGIDDLADAYINWINVATQELAPTIPRQQPAPIHLHIVGGRLELIDSQNPVGSLRPDARARILNAAFSLLQTAMNIVGNETNLKKGFVPPCSALLDALQSNPASFSPEFVGLLARLIRSNVTKFENELPDGAPQAFIEALNATDTLVSQYVEWREYLVAEAGRNITKENAEAIVGLSTKVADHLDEYTEVVDHRIADRLRAILQPTLDGINNNEAIAVPLLFSLSNIMARVSELILNSLETIGTVGATASGAALLLFATGFVQRFGAAAADVGLTFLRAMQDVISKAAKH
jgi:hypothetical protein